MGQIVLARHIDDHGAVTLVTEAGETVAAWPDIDTAQRYAGAMLFGADNPDDARAVAGVLGVAE
ncbi:hypothetical protein [Mycolicibacterium sp. GESEQ-9]|uniref:hypothetical protein n=1 Tax=unclassified Mycolicibacterium TaxID=2636767 RepID=UPI001B31CCA7|nr:hypothetical protein [Mycolicibacterium sp. GESEQ-9]